MKIKFIFTDYHIVDLPEDFPTWTEEEQLSYCQDAAEIFRNESNTMRWEILDDRN